MRLIGHILHLSKKDIEAAGISYRTAEKWSFKIKDPNDKRCDLFPYDDIAEKYKLCIIKHLGCEPYEYAAREPIRNLIRKDFKAEEFFENYCFPDGRTLYNDKKGEERKYIDRYTHDASIIQTIIRITENKKAFKNQFPGVSIEQFWNIMIHIVGESDNTDLPNSKRRILDAISRYKELGYHGIISPRFGNKNRAKIGKTDTGYDETIADMQRRTVRKLLTKHNNFDNAQIANLSNIIFVKKGWQPISPATIYNLRKEFAHLIKPGNSGLRAYRNELAMQVKRAAPKYPLAMVTVDGWTAELLFQERKTDAKGNTKIDYSGRLVIVVVLDPFCKYPLGYAIGERENTNLIREANLNALNHIRELFGQYRPWQLQSDRYGIKELTPFYNGIAKLFTPAAVGNAKAKVIEPYFKYLNKKYCQYDRFWSGFGVKARKEAQPNIEYLDKIKQQMPDKEGVRAKLEAIIVAERLKKQAKYVQGWETLSDEDKFAITREQYLIAFGKQTSRTIRLTGDGITPCINGIDYAFDTFNPEFRHHSQTDWQLFYDTSDEQSELGLRDILAVSSDNKHRFLLHGKMSIPAAIRDQEPKHFAIRATIAEFNKEREREIVQTYIKDEEVFQEIISSIPLSIDDHQEAALKLMFTDKTGQQKEGLQDAKRLGKLNKADTKRIEAEHKTAEQTWQDEQLAYLTNKVNFNNYMD